MVRDLMRKLVVIVALCAAVPLAAQDQPQATPPKPAPAPTLEKPGMAAPDAKSEKPAKPAAPKPSNPDSGRTVEEIIARVNNEIITRSEYDKARQTAEEDAKSECQNRCTPEQLQSALEDCKNNIRNTLLTQRVIGSEVGSHITISDDEVSKYYEAHKAEYVRPEQVALREIVVSTEGKKPEELPDLKKKAETALKRVQDGEDFGEIAKRLSDGSTKSQGGFLGVYKRGELSKELEDKVFKMKRKELTEVMETKQGFLILQVLEHYDEGQQALDKVKNEIMDKLYSGRMEPAMREYLKTLREQSYVVIKPGFQDIAGGGGSEIQEVSATPEVSKQKKGHKKFLLFGKRSSSGQ